MGTRGLIYAALCDLFENLSTNKVKPHPIVQLAGVAAVLVHRFGAVASSKKVKCHRMSADEIDETSMRDLFVPFRASSFSFNAHLFV